MEEQREAAAQRAGREQRGGRAAGAPGAAPARDAESDAQGPPRMDMVDLVVEQWRQERPDLDVEAMGVFARLARAALVLGGAVEKVFAEHVLRGGEFDVLAALRRWGRPTR